MAESYFDRHLVRWSSRENIAAGKTSLLAVAEVIFSVAAYWWIAWYFDTYAHLLISVLVAPLVLLRSDESVVLGVAMFRRYWNPKIVSLSSAKGESLFIVTAVVAGGAGWMAADWFLVGHDGWALLWRSMLFGIFAVNVGVAVSVAAAGAGWGSVAGAITTLAAVMGAGAVAVAVAGAVAAAVAGAVAVAGAIAGAATATVIMAVAGPGVNPGAGAAMGAVAVLGPGLGVGFLIRTVATRLIASLRHIHRGAAAFPKNWRHTLFQIDLRCAPELVPGIGEEEPTLDFGQMIERWFFGTTIVEKTVGAILFPVFFIPSLLYRYSLKSTCWLYLPLIYVAHLPRPLRDGEGRLIWVRALPAKFIEWIRFWLAGLTLGIALFALTDAAALRDLLTAAGAGETPVTIFSLLVVFDFGDIRPWQYFTLPSAALTILLVLWLDSIRKDEAAGARLDAFGWKIHLAIRADRVRSLLVYIWLGLALYYFVDYAYGRCRLPDWMASWLQWPFGPVACPAPGE